MPTVSNPTLLAQLLQGAVVAYGVSFVLAVFRPQLARGSVVVGAGLHLGWLVWRGVAIGYLPLTNKTESFSAASLALAVVALIFWAPVRSFVLPQLALAVAAGLAAVTFPQELAYPSPLLRTLWYPAHVPLSFLAIGIWVAAGGASISWWVTGDRVWLQRVDRFALQGFGLWSAAMICGGVWGVVAWGAYFMWDPKMIWSVILWFHYASFLHVRLTPSLQQRAWVRPALAFAGIAWVLVAYVGTSFFFGKSSHAF